MSTKDVIKDSVLNSFTGGSDLSPKSIVFTLFMAIVIGLYIFAIYKLTAKSALYSRDFNITIACIPIIIAVIMIAMQSNLIVSLGMVGSLSIVRFRNAVKNPLDLLYVFWAVSAGIVCGVNLMILAIVLCFSLTLLTVILQLIPVSKASSILVISINNKEINLDELKSIIEKHAKSVKQKSLTQKAYCTEVIYELSAKDDTALKNALESISDISEFCLLSHDGEFRA